MGYYYEFHIKVKLKKDLPVEVIKFLQSWIVEQTYKPFIVDHALFRLERWGSCFYHSAYHGAPTFDKLSSGYYLLQLNGEIKHGYKEIEEAVNWLSQYVVGRKKKQYVGWYKGESWEVPRINLYVEKQL